MGKIDDALKKMGEEPEGKSKGEKTQKEKKGKKLSQLDEIYRPDEEKSSSHLAIPSIDSWDERLLVAINDQSVLEGLRRLRTKILYPDNSSTPKSILVTSAGPGEGKSFVAANLGIIMARGLEQYALLIDCDLRKPSLANMFGFKNIQGLSSHLAEDVPLEEILCKTVINKLTIIPSGPPPENPFELIASEKMPTMIDEIVSRYKDRLVIFDSPPVHGASESAVLAQHVEGVILVVKWGGAGRDQIKKLVQAIGHEKLIGVVFNNFEMTSLDRKLKEEGYYQYYSEGYY